MMHTAELLEFFMQHRGDAIVIPGRGGRHWVPMSDGPFDLPVGDPVLEAAVASNHISARVERVGPIFRPPPRVVESSIDKFTSAGFRVTTTYDRMDEGLGRQQVSQGVLVLVPKQ